MRRGQFGLWVVAVVMVFAAAGALAWTGLARAATPPSGQVDWPGYGGGPRQIRYSTLGQINKESVARLEVAWTYDTGERGAMQTQPVVVNGVLYGYTPTHKTVALNAATGEAIWTFDSGIRGAGPNRGVMYWREGDDARVFSAVDNYVYALDAATGRVITGFGENGRIDLRDGLGRDPATQGVRLTSPGAIYKDLMIVGGRVGEGLPTSPGDVRAYDVRTGALRWSFHTIPHPGESGYDTWPADAWTYSGAANSWPGMAVDEARGIVYVPTGSAASDFYGADRLGDDLFANCLLALDAATGKRLWHFQVVHHDIWDRDLPSPPSLVTVERAGRTIDAVAQATKHGYVFVFDRTTGEPLFPIESRPFPESTVPGERTSAMQPIPVLPKPFARQRLTADLLTTRTPDAHAWAEEAFKTFHSDGQFVPLDTNRPTVVFPGFDGGAEWGGQAFDPETGLYYVNANDLAWTGSLAPNTGSQSGRGLYLQHCASCHRDDRAGSPPSIPSLVTVGERRTFADVSGVIRRGAGRMPAFPALDQTAVNAIVQYLVTGRETPTAARGGRGRPEPAMSPLINDDFRFTGYRKFLDPEGYPATAPPWGTLSAINLNTGAYAWQVPLGEYPELAAQGMTGTGSENYGGPIVTAGGLVIIGATNQDRKLRAFDKATGALIWEAVMPGPGRATPATYAVDGRQYIAIALGGVSAEARGAGAGGAGRSSTDSRGAATTAKYIAFALPASGAR
jgi:quinoprotein glucose dehydrogenase